jgi:hypothetical protein
MLKTLYIQHEGNTDDEVNGNVTTSSFEEISKDQLGKKMTVCGGAL